MSASEVRLGKNEMASATPGRNRTFNLPDVVTDRLDALLQVMEDQGFRAERTDLVAALICEAEPNGPELQRIVQDYRTMRVRQVVLGADPESTTVVVKPAGPGPRKRFAWRAKTQSPGGQEPQV